MRDGTQAWTRLRLEGCMRGLSLDPPLPKAMEVTAVAAWVKGSIYGKRERSFLFWMEDGGKPLRKIRCVF